MFAPVHGNNNLSFIMTHLCSYLPSSNTRFKELTVVLAVVVSSWHTNYEVQYLMMCCIVVDGHAFIFFLFTCL